MPGKKLINAATFCLVFYTLFFAKQKHILCVAYYFKCVALRIQNLCAEG